MQGCKVNVFFGLIFKFNMICVHVTLLETVESVNQKSFDFTVQSRG